ncbi:MAG: hypothetical protein ACRCUY_04850 [Thermoguttaceae bacterium]
MAAAQEITHISSQIAAETVAIDFYIDVIDKMLLFSTKARN